MVGDVTAVVLFFAFVIDMAWSLSRTPVRAPGFETLVIIIVLFVLVAADLIRRKV